MNYRKNSVSVQGIYIITCAITADGLRRGSGACAVGGAADRFRRGEGLGALEEGWEAGSATEALHQPALGESALRAEDAARSSTVLAPKRD